jgi:AcrR family transcriptional regulator
LAAILDQLPICTVTRWKSTNVRAIFPEVALRKGQDTRQIILGHAASLASRIGLSGLTIGALAEELKLSKSGLFAHFKSKEQLQLEVLDYAAGRFVEVVLKPALAAPRGEPRVRTLFEGWLHWPVRSGLVGGCIFVSAASELDDQPGPIRDRLVELQKDWMETMANTINSGINEGHFRSDADPEQFAQDLYGVMLALHHAHRLLRDPKSTERARRSFEAILTNLRQR